MAARELTSELRHRQQNRRATTTILVVLLMLFFAFWYAYSYYRAAGDSEATPQAGASCRPFDPRVPTPATTKVNVYNASTRNGLAARTAAALRQRGFVIGEVRNDPLQRDVTGVEVRYGPTGRSRAILVVPLGGKGTTGLKDGRKDASVDFVVGSAFVALAPTRTPSGLPMCPSPSTSPSASAPKSPT